MSTLTTIEQSYDSPHTPNFDKWQLYTSGLTSPQNYIDWAWYYIIGAALQRRVWIGDDNQQCFANKYCILIGKPGIGKGIVLKEVTRFLTYWKLKDFVAVNSNVGRNADEKGQSALVAEADLKKANETEIQSSAKNKDIAEPVLYPLAADSTTYQSLIEALGDCYRRINFNYVDAAGNNKLGIYGHGSICFVLQELASLMRKKTDDMINLLLALYDCPVDYEYRTLSRGKDRIRRGCANIIAGTTPSFMQSTFDEKLADEGFNSRTFYIFAARNRQNQFFLKPLTEEQIAVRKDLYQHIFNLSFLYGRITIDQETRDFLEQWWNEHENDPSNRTNKSPKLSPYYSRKQLHVQKLAMAMHFSESVTMHIPLETFKRALAFLDREERTMHMAITMEGNNPAARVSRRVLDLLGFGKKNFVELVTETYNMQGGDQKGLEEVLQFLELTNQIRIGFEIDENTDEKVTYYEMIK